MKNMMKKMWLLTATALLAFTSMAQADDAPQMNKDSKMREGYNPSARPTAKSGWGIFVSGDFLWWKATQDDLQYTACFNDGFPACPGKENFFLDSLKGEVREPDFQWDPGFRVGLGFTLPRDGWDVSFQWTRFYTDARDKCCAFPCDLISSTVVNGNDAALAAGTTFTKSACCKSNPCGNCPQCCPGFDCDCCCEPCCPCCDVCFECCCPTSLVPTLCPVIFPTNYLTTTVATADWKLRLNLLDGEIGREFHTSKWLTLRPFFGVRGTWITQCYDVKYQSGVFIEDQVPEQGGFAAAEADFNGCMICCTDFESCYEGAGPRIGLNSEWLLGAGFGLYANAALSLIYGEFDFTQISNVCLCGELKTVVSGEFPPITITQDIDDCGRFELRDKFHSGKLITDLALGVQWQGTFAKDRVGLLLQIGYDHHLFLNQNPLIHLMDQTNFSPLVPLLNLTSPFGGPLLPTQTVANKQLGISDRRHGDLSLQGLTVSARLDF